MKITSTALCLSLLLLSPLTFAEKNIYGLNEQIQVLDLDLKLEAKLDTGAKTASLSARDIEQFKRDGKDWVRFRLAIDGVDRDEVFEHPVSRISRIKRRAGDYDAENEKSYTARPVISLELCMGERQRAVEVNLTDRSSFQYPFLIGSDALVIFDALVDPSLTFVAGKPACEQEKSSAE